MIGSPDIRVVIQCVDVNPQVGVLRDGDSIDHGVLGGGAGDEGNSTVQPQGFLHAHGQVRQLVQVLPVMMQ